MTDVSLSAGGKAVRSHGSGTGNAHPGCDVRPANRNDLDAINRVIDAAVMSWSLPERVRRLSLPVYRYTPVDLAHLEMVVAVSTRDSVIGVAAWELADDTDTPEGSTALLLHGIHVDPLYHRQGVGRRLFLAAEQAACVGRYDGLLVKAQQEATGFFLAQGMYRLEVSDPLRQYANRLWKSLSG
jgi:GNAT superfamily N-acetyltransferase